MPTVDYTLDVGGDLGEETGIAAVKRGLIGDEVESFKKHPGTGDENNFWLLENLEVPAAEIDTGGGRTAHCGEDRCPIRGSVSQ